MKTDFIYDYVEDCEEGVSQYEDVDFESERIVPARYVHALLQTDERNPYIEALPVFRDKQAAWKSYGHSLNGYRWENVKNMTMAQKAMQVRQLKSVRLPLPFHSVLEQEFYLALVDSYRQRKQRVVKDHPITYVANNAEQTSTRILYGDQAESTSAGIALTGFSGCGKSSAIKELVSRYPPCIIHGNQKDGYFIQIPYLVVNCVVGSNFSAMYAQVGYALDRLLNPGQNIYGQEIEKTHGLGQKAAKVCSLIEKFGIGAIIFDEIQYVNFFTTNQNENSFDSLLSLANQSKFLMVAVGTEEARSKMLCSLRVARRLGTHIKADEYCKPGDFFDSMVEKLFYYQWFDEHVEVTDEIIDALYEVTSGIVDQLVTIYMAMHLEYFRRKNKPKIDAEFIKDVSKKHYKDIQTLLGAIRNGEENSSKSQGDKDIDDGLLALAKQEEQAAAAQMLVEQKGQTYSEAMQLENITAGIRKYFKEFSESQIQDAYRKVIQRKSSAGKDEDEIGRLVLDLLQKQPKRNTAQSVNKPEQNTMRTSLGVTVTT